MISSHFNKPFLALNPEKIPTNGNRNIDRINSLPNAPNDTPLNIVKNITTKMTTVASEKTLYLFIQIHLLKSRCYSHVKLPFNRSDIVTYHTIYFSP